MEKYDIYLFDFDGTLFNTLPALKMVFKNSYKEYGVDVSDEECLQFSREPLPDSYQRKGLKMDVFWDFVKVINFYLNGEESARLTETYDDTEIFHQYVLDHDIKMGVVTSNNIPHVKDIYRVKNIDCSNFVVFVGNQEAPTPKPDPEPINKALELMNYQGDLKKVVYIGDSLYDCLAATRAGISTYLLDRDNAFKDAPYEIIHSLMDLFKEV